MDKLLDFLWEKIFGPLFVVLMVAFLLALLFVMWKVPTVMYFGLLSAIIAYGIYCYVQVREERKKDGQKED